MALGVHLLPPFLRQCSVLRVFKATATQNRGKSKQTSIEWRDRTGDPPAQKAVHQPTELRLLLIKVKMQCSSFEAVTGKIYRLLHHLLPPNMAWNCWKFNWEKKNKSCKFVLPNSYPCIHKEVGAKLSEWSGLKWGKYLFHILHWADIISNDSQKCSTILKTLLLIVLIK